MLANAGIHALAILNLYRGDKRMDARIREHDSASPIQLNALKHQTPGPPLQNTQYLHYLLAPRSKLVHFQYSTIV